MVYSSFSSAIRGATIDRNESNIPKFESDDLNLVNYILLGDGVHFDFVLGHDYQASSVGFPDEVGDGMVSSHFKFCMVFAQFRLGHDYNICLAFLNAKLSCGSLDG